MGKYLWVPAAEGFKLIVHPPHALQPAFQVVGLKIHPGLRNLVREDQEALFLHGAGDLFGDFLRLPDGSGDIAGKGFVRVPQHGRAHSQGRQQGNPDALMMMI